ncbi:secondary thiamine-phosphate synthase enzyme YjbQ [Thermosulfurimonas sp. F29]|uniref:secondary thiamine-phosphate synthase enzyme YjbQ n=1 Tax=Thermosulfurimonas sp. F29 TaxID=2867247 RepID=UPI001C8297E5|nr:secondary thiamine-phosphate synthase enzyme YjbQ [Thermosulfurimonas sp. F29]MBX6423689.1 secondary thiamine-phosphate synthase enzyme YjbQ [Thermosulfurimonas sp. F29]
MEVITVKSTARAQFIDITEEVARRLKGVKSGVCFLYVPHTTAGLVINEGADPAVAEDILNVYERLAPYDYAYRHLEGNSPAHVKASLTGPCLSILVEDGRPVLGTWQRIFFAEYDGPRTRKVYLKVMEG